MMYLKLGLVVVWLILGVFWMFVGDNPAAAIGCLVMSKLETI